VSTNAAATTTHVAHVWSGPTEGTTDTPVQRSDRQLIDRRELRALGPQPSLYAPLLGHGACAASQANNFLLMALKSCTIIKRVTDWQQSHSPTHHCNNIALLEPHYEP
jgi:hypothetical protein